MPFTDTPDNVLASVTDLGRNLMARVALGQIAIKAIGFAVGRGGYNDTNPVHIKPIDKSLITLEDRFFPPLLDPVADFSLVETPHPNTLVMNCRLSKMDGNAGLGEVGIWVEIVMSTNPAEVGERHLYAVAHMPINVKTQKQVLVFRVLVQL